MINFHDKLLSKAHLFVSHSLSQLRIDTCSKMSTGTSDDGLRTDFIIAVSVVGSACGLLLIAVIGLIIWNIQLSKKIKKLDPFVNFRLQRPKMYPHQAELQGSCPEPTNHAHDNPSFFRTNLHQDRSILNPIAQRNLTSIDNGNFMYGNPNGKMNSFRELDYLDRDSKFY